MTKDIQRLLPSGAFQEKARKLIGDVSRRAARLGNNFALRVIGSLPFSATADFNSGLVDGKFVQPAVRIRLNGDEETSLASHPGVEIEHDEIGPFVLSPASAANLAERALTKAAEKDQE